MPTPGFSAKLELDAGTGSYVLVAQSTMIKLPTQSVAKIDGTYLGMSTPYKLFTPGLTDAGSVAFECWYSKATWTQLQAVLGLLKITTQMPATGANVMWKITLPDDDGSGADTAQTFIFNGFLSKLDMSVEVEANMKIVGDITVNGAVTVG